MHGAEQLDATAWRPARALGCFVDDAAGREPKDGDITFLSNGPSATEHVEVFRSIDAAGYHASAAGQGTREVQSAANVTRTTDDQRANGGARMLSGPLPYGGDMRKLVGWVDLDCVPWTAEMSGPAVGEDATPGGGSRGVPRWLVTLGVGGAIAGAAALARRRQEPPPPPWTR